MGTAVKVLVYGLGRSGGAAARLLRRQGHDVWTYDAAAPQGDDLSALGCVRTDTPLEVSADLCVAAPGVPYDAPDLVALRAKGIETIGEVEWVYRTVPAPILGVTGTAGKTTTTRWLTHVLSRAGIDAHAGGNVDPALSAVAEPGRTLVTEVSSFMLERSPTLKPEVAVILNLGTDHLDRHGTVAAYHALKGRLIANLDASDTFVYNHDDPTLRTWAARSSAQPLGFSANDPLAAAYLDGDALTLHNEPLLTGTDLQLVGRQHRLNALAVALAASAYGLNRNQIRTGLASFTGVPGRYSLVAEAAGVRFIEDSIATRTLSVQAALEATPAPVVWLVGGRDKGAELDPLESLVRERVVRCIGFGEAGKTFADRVSAWTKTDYIGTRDGERALLEAVTLAAETLKETGGTVLLAPLATSFDQFGDYKGRADAFRQAALTVARTLAATDLTATEPAWTLS